MKQRLFLHIGFPKTRTTSVQVFLASNAEPLGRDGLIYPMVSGPRPDLPNGRRLLTSDLHNAGWQDEIEETWARAKAEILRSGAAGVISEEGFSILQDMSVWERLDLGRDFDVSVICYYRRSIDFLASTYGQNTPSANWRNTLPLDAFVLDTTLVEDGIARIYDYAAMFGMENVILRPFETATFRNGSLIEDFLSILGVDDLSGYRAVDHENPSYNRNDVEICRIFNTLDLNPLGRRLAITGHPDPRILDTVPDEIIRRCVDKYHEAECKLAMDFLGRAQLFYEKYPPIYGTPRAA